MTELTLRRNPSSDDLEKVRHTPVRTPARRRNECVYYDVQIYALPRWILPVTMARIATSCATWFRMSLIVRGGGGAVAFGLRGLESRPTSAPRLLRLALLLRYTNIASQCHYHQHHITTVTYPSLFPSLPPWPRLLRLINWTASSTSHLSHYAPAVMPTLRRLAR